MTAGQILTLLSFMLLATLAWALLLGGAVGIAAMWEAVTR